MNINHSPLSFCRNVTGHVIKILNNPFHYLLLMEPFTSHQLLTTKPVTCLTLINKVYRSAYRNVETTDTFGHLELISY